MRRLTFLGDVYLPDAVEVSFDVGDYVPNLEAPVTTHDVAFPGKVNLRVGANLLSECFRRHPVAVCLGNNHIMDYGASGYRDTVEAMRKDDIPFFGAGLREENEHNPVLVRWGEFSLAFSGYVCATTTPVFSAEGRPGVAALDGDRIKADIAVARHQGADRIVICFHWGAQESSYPRLEDVAIARRAVDAGADLIVGHHSHCVQRWEIYKGKPIFYGLGNCLMPDLVLPAQYDPATGLPTTVYRKRQLPWNQRSLAVGWSPMDGSVDIRELRYSRGKLSSASSSLREGRLCIGDRARYARQSRREYSRRQFLGRVHRFVDRPRVPSLSSLKSLWNLIRRPEMK